MPLHLPAVGTVVLLMKLGWWVKRWADNGFDHHAANRAFLKDIHWDDICSLSSDGATAVETMLKTPLNIDSHNDFRRVVMQLESCRSRFHRLPQEVQEIFNGKGHVDRLLEERIQHVTLRYAEAILGSLEDGSPAEQLYAIYLSLYLLGRLNKPLPTPASVEVRNKLIELHRSRKTRRDGQVARMLEGLSSQVAYELSLKLSGLPLVQRIPSVNTDYILHALMEYSIAGLPYPPIYQEIVGSVIGKT